MLAREWSRAGSAYREALEIAVAGSDDWYISWCVIGAGGIAASQGNPRQATQLLASGIAEQQRLAILLRPHVQSALDQITATLRARLGEEAFSGAAESGRAMPMDTAIGMAFETFAALEPEDDRSAAPYGLTRRERDVLRLMAEGQADREIADALFVARPTASKHVAAILSKIGVDSRTAAVAIAIRLGLA